MPSRENVEAYQTLEMCVAQLVGEINGKLATLDLPHAPISYLHRSISPTELRALYALGDVLLVTSLRDGQNLVASEVRASG